MKKILRILMTVMVLVAATSVNAQLVIKIRPVAPRIVRVAAPSPRHIWVDEDWRWENNRYVYNGGRWMEPPVGYARWVPGHWKETRRRGWVWKPGHWV